MFTRIILTALVSTSLTLSALGDSPMEQLESEQLSDGAMAELSFLVGDFLIEETQYRPDGSVHEQGEGGMVQVRPALNGNYMAIISTQPQDPDDEDITFWLLTWHPGQSEYVTAVYESDDPDSGTLRGILEGATLTLTSEEFELPDGRVLMFRIEITHSDDGNLRSKMERGIDGEWSLGGTSVWYRQ